jgi:DNA-binding PadR family transcriptional regulator
LELQEQDLRIERHTGDRPFSGHRHGCGERSRGRHGGPRGSRFGAEDDMDWGGEARGHRRGGRRRMFDGGELRLVLLKLIADKPRHGYHLIHAIEELTGGAYSPSPGVVYPTLTLLSEMELIGEQLSEGARKIYAITSAGAAHLEERAEEVAALFARLDALAALRERTDAAPVRRAMHNLRSVLMHRLGEGLDKEKLYAAVELIDEVARKIERL